MLNVPRLPWQIWMASTEQVCFHNLRSSFDFPSSADMLREHDESTEVNTAAHGHKDPTQEPHTGASERAVSRV